MDDDQPATPVTPASADAKPVNESFVATHPMLSLGAALAVGAGIGLLLPRARAVATVGVAASKAGARLGSTAKSAVSTFAAIDTARSLFTALAGAGEKVGAGIRSGAHDLAAKLPDKGDIKAGAREASRQLTEVVDHARDRLRRH